MDAWGHHVARRRAAGIEALLRQSFTDDVAVGHHPDQPVVLSNRNGADVMLTHQFREFGYWRVWTDPVDAFVHRVLDFHGGPPLRNRISARELAQNQTTVGFRKARRLHPPWLRQRGGRLANALHRAR